MTLNTGEQTAKRSKKLKLFWIFFRVLWTALSVAKSEISKQSMRWDGMCMAEKTTSYSQKRPSHKIQHALLAKEILRKAAAEQLNVKKSEPSKANHKFWTTLYLFKREHLYFDEQCPREVHVRNNSHRARTKVHLFAITAQEEVDYFCQGHIDCTEKYDKVGESFSNDINSAWCPSVFVIACPQQL